MVRVGTGTEAAALSRAQRLNALKRIISRKQVKDALRRAALTNRIYEHGHRPGTGEDRPVGRSGEGPGRWPGGWRAKKTGSAPDIAPTGRGIRTC